MVSLLCCSACVTTANAMINTKNTNTPVYYNNNMLNTQIFKNNMLNNIINCSDKTGMILKGNNINNNKIINDIN